MADSNCNPGPGTYELWKNPDQLLKNKIPIGQKYKDKNDNYIPGPGKYDPKCDF